LGSSRVGERLNHDKIPEKLDGGGMGGVFCAPYSRPRRYMRSIVILIALITLCRGSSAQSLEIHIINVGWGSSVFVQGPNGSTMLLEGGRNGKGTSEIIPYLESLGVRPSDGLDYTIAGHQRSDHIGGLDEVIQAGYDVRISNFFNGSNHFPDDHSADDWNQAASGTTAGKPVPMPVGHVIDLGGGAKATCVARNGKIVGGKEVPVSIENDRSIALLIQYKGFDFLWGSDLGGGRDDYECTKRNHSEQVDVESYVIKAIVPGGAHPLISKGGIDVLYVNHHGSESSTNSTLMNLAQPEVAVIATGDGQASDWNVPHSNVVSNVLHSKASCVTAPPALVLQTEEGRPRGSKTSRAGYSVGNIKIVTNGSDYSIDGDGDVTQGPVEVSDANLPRTLTVDEPD
jgi:beta-lactamase superfamily II metal-dependent hydrolase